MRRSELTAARRRKEMMRKQPALKPDLRTKSRLKTIFIF